MYYIMFTRQKRNLLLLFLACVTLVFSAFSQENSQDPITGMKRLAYPELLPYLYSTGTVTRQDNNYDPSGANRDGKFWNFDKHRDEHGDVVIFDEYGPGCLYRQHMNCFMIGGDVEGVRIKYYFDDEETPRIDLPLGSFFHHNLESPFTAPLAYMQTNLDEKPGQARFSIMYYPFMFQKRLKVTMSPSIERIYQWYQYTHLIYPADAVVPSWSGAANKEEEELVRLMWQNCGSDPKSTKGNLIEKGEGKLDYNPVVLFDKKGEYSIASIKIKMDPWNMETFAATKIQMFWDDSEEPAVDMAIGQFFGGGGPYDQTWKTGQLGPYIDGRRVVQAPEEWEGKLKTLMFGFDNASQTFYCYWPMPFWKTGKIQLAITAYNDPKDANFQWEVQYKPSNEMEYQEDACGHFYAKREIDVDDGTNSFSTLFETEGRGHVVALQMWLKEFLMDGDEFCYFDGCATPRIHGSGSEDDIGNQGWGGVQNFKPLWGGIYSGTHGAYRIYQGAPLIFYNEISHRVGHSMIRGGEEVRKMRPRTNTLNYYYLSPNPDILTLTDELDVGDAESEAKHKYKIVGETWKKEFSDDYDRPEEMRKTRSIKDAGRAFTGKSSFTVQINPDNDGVRIRRRIYRKDNGIQIAKVYVDGKEISRPWYIETYSIGVAERSAIPAKPKPDARHGFDAWFESDFEIPGSYTKGKKEISITLEHVPVDAKPKDILDENNEFYYWVYTYPASFASAGKPVIELQPAKEKLDNLKQGIDHPVSCFKDFAIADKNKKAEIFGTGDVGISFKDKKVAIIEIRLINDVYRVDPSHSMASKFISLDGKTVSFTGTLKVKSNHKYLIPTNVKTVK